MTILIISVQIMTFYFFTETRTENFDLADSLLEDNTVLIKSNDNDDFLFAIHGICTLIKK